MNIKLKGIRMQVVFRENKEEGRFVRSLPVDTCFSPQLNNARMLRHH